MIARLAGWAMLALGVVLDLAVFLFFASLAVVTVGHLVQLTYPAPIAE